MTRLTYILLFFSLSIHAQNMVLIEGYKEEIVWVTDYTGHEIIVPDSLTLKVGKRWQHEMRAGQVDYQEALRQIDRIELIGADHSFVSKNEKGVIYLNQDLNDFPYCKIAAIYQELFINNGGKLDRQTRPLAISKFNVTDKTEAMFERQFKNGYIFTYIIKELQ